VLVHRALDADGIERAVHQHPLVRVHGVAPAAMELARVHKRVESGHRHDAWRSVLAYATPAEHDVIVTQLERALALWTLYRDGVARECGLSR
jgi:hypothetical protein